MSNLGLSLDSLDFLTSVVILIVTSGFVNALLQYFKLNICQDARLIQAVVLFLLSVIYNSPFGFVMSIIELVIGVADYLAVSNPSFAWLDPNLA
jgi:hypothetical protein